MVDTGSFNSRSLAGQSSQGFLRDRGAGGAPLQHHPHRRLDVSGGFPKFRGASLTLWGSYSKEYSIFGSMSGPPILETTI